MDQPPKLNNLEKEVEPKSPEELKLIEARTKYAEAYRAFLAQRKENTGVVKNAWRSVFGSNVPESEITPELKQLEQEYDQKAVELGQAMLEAKKSELGNSLSPQEIADELKKFKQGDIFNKIIVQEQEELNNLKAENLPPKEKNVAKKVLDWYLSKSRPIKVAISTFVCSGIILGSSVLMSGAAISAGAAGTYMVGKYSRSLAGGTISSAAMESIDLFFKDMSAEKRAEAQKLLAEQFSEEGEFGINLQEAKKENARILEEERKAKRNRLIGKALVGVAVGGLASYEMGQGTGIGSAHADELDLPKHTPITENPTPQGTTPAQIDSLLKVRDSLIPHKVASIVAEAKPDSSSIANAQARLDTLKASFAEHGTHTPTSEAAIKIAEEELNNLKQNTTINIPPSTEDILSAPKTSDFSFDKPKTDPLLDYEKPKPSIFEQYASEHPLTPTEVFHNQGISFEHGKGGIQGILDLKAQIKSEYPDISKAPQSVQDFMNADATKEAIKLGLYDPNNTNESALIQEGSILKFDEQGNLLFGKPDTSGNIPILEKYDGNMIDTDKPIIKPEPAPIPKTELEIKPNIIDTDPKIKLSPEARTPEELKEMLEAKYAKTVPFHDYERPYARPIETGTPQLKPDGLYQYDGVPPKTPDITHAQIPDARTLEILKLHPEFVINNPYVLSTQQLSETYNVHYQNINHLLPHDTAENWREVAQFKARDLLKSNPAEEGTVWGPIVSYAQQLQTESGLKPQDGFIKKETFEHYEARALQKIASEGHLEKLRLHTPVPKSPDFHQTQQVLQPEAQHTTQALHPEIKQENTTNMPVQKDGDIIIQKSVHYPLFDSAKVHFSYDENGNPKDVLFTKNTNRLSGRELSSNNFMQEMIKWATEHNKDQQWEIDKITVDLNSLYKKLAVYDNLRGDATYAKEAEFVRDTITRDLRWLSEYGNIVDFSKLPPEFQIKK